MVRVIASLFAVTWMWCAAAVAQTYPTYQELYVNDFAGILDETEAAEIRAMLQEVQAQRGIEFTVVTITRMAEYGHDGAIEPFATGLFNNWGVGNATRNDGLMLLVSQQDRKLRIEVGSGYGQAKNVPMKRIIDRVILPRFRDNDFPGGIRDGVEHIIHDVTGFWPGTFDAGVVQRTWTGLLRTFGAWLSVLLIPAAGIAFWLWRKVVRARPRTCPNDSTRMGLVLDEFEDNHLKSGQTTEEDIGSIEYDVWKCPTCEHVTVEAYRKWFTRYGACRECGFKTVEGDSVTEVQATTTSTGRRRTDYHCRHCAADYSTHSTIPMITKSSSSSSSSGSSFGGGSSSGGGASGSW